MQDGRARATGRHNAIRGAIPALTALVLFAAMAGLRAAGATAAYERIIKLWGFDAFRFPFLDTDTVLSALRCLRRGVDVFAANPCDVLERVYDYSPLWLVGAVFPVTTGWIAPVGLAVDFMFFASLLLLPAGRSRGAVTLIALAAVSSASAYAVERGNNDLVIFTLTVLAATAMSRSPRWRWAGYGAALLAGLLKYYPMTLMALALRERASRFLAVAAASCVLVALFVVLAGHDLVRALQLIPRGSYFGDMFGAITVAGGIARIAQLSDGVRLAMQWAMVLGAGWIGVRRGLAQGFRDDIERLSDRERDFLLAGALLVLGCFFSAQNIGYRGVNLILVVPGLTALWRTGRARNDYRMHAILAVAVAWIMSIREIIVEVSMPFGRQFELFGDAVGWVLSQVLWWVLITMLIACATALLARCRMAETTLGLVRRTSVRSAAAL